VQLLLFMITLRTAWLLLIKFLVDMNNEQLKLLQQNAMVRHSKEYKKLPVPIIAKRKRKKKVKCKPILKIKTVPKLTKKQLFELKCEAIKLIAAKFDKF
jgi:hypothetical protein